MPSYRLYRLDGAGKIITADWIEADDADDALRKAKAAPPHGTVELWERGRLLGRFRGGKPV